MAEKTRPREASAAAKPRRDKSRPSARSSSRSSLQPSSKASRKSDPRRDSLAPPAEVSLPGDGDTGDSLDVGDILAELLHRVVLECMFRKGVPFTVCRARDAILCVAEWRFLTRDEGDPDPGGDPDPERAGAWSEDEEPQPCPADSCAHGAVPVLQVPLSPGENPPVTAEAAPGADTVLGARLSRGEVLSAKPPYRDPPAAAEAPPACPVRVPAAVSAPLVPGSPLPEPPPAPRSPVRPPRPRPARPCPSRPPAPRPAEPPVRGGPRRSRGTVEGFDGRESPSPASSCASLKPIRPGRTPRGSGAAREGPGAVPGGARPGPRRLSVRSVRPRVKVLDVFPELERPRPRDPRRTGRGTEPGGPRDRPPPPGPPQPPLRPPSPESRPCDPWLGSALLAPGVTVRWGGSERRGPGTAGLEQEEEEDREDEEGRKAERELRPILPFPAFRLQADAEGSACKTCWECGSSGADPPGSCPSSAGTLFLGAPCPTCTWAGAVARGPSAALLKRTEINKSK